MVWSVFTNTVAGPGFLAGDYVGASGEVTVAAGVGANVLMRRSPSALSRYSPYPSAGRRALISRWVSQPFILVFRDNDDITNRTFRTGFVRRNASVWLMAGYFSQSMLTTESPKVRSG
jgi:hypothetical protein